MTQEQARIPIVAPGTDAGATDVPRDERIRTLIILIEELSELRSRVGPPPPLLEGELTMPQLRVLFTLVRLGPCRLGELADALSMAPPNATAIVDRLEAQGFVERAPDPDDRRAVRATPTERGRRIVEAFFTAGRIHLADVLGELTDAEIETVRRGYTTFVRALRRRAEARAPRS